MKKIAILSIFLLISSCTRSDYKFEILSGTKNLEAGNTEMNYQIKDGEEILKSFAIVHEKIMHFIVVRNDLQDFQHLHPSYDENTGEFSIDLNLPNEGDYRLFADFTPTGKKSPVTLFQDITIGDAKDTEPVVIDSNNVKNTGDYEVTYSFPKEIEAGTAIKYTLEIKKAGIDVNNLEMYLGGLAHGLIIKKEDLDFIHSHNLNNDIKGPKIDFETVFPESGIYKIFTQFQHEGQIITSEYVIEVKENKSGASSSMKH